MNLNEARVAVLAHHDYQELELWYPVLRLREEGAEVVLVGPNTAAPSVSKQGHPAYADIASADADAAEFDAVVVPGGQSPERMRNDPNMVKLVREVHDRGGLVATVCHAGWMLASADIAKGRKVTCVHVIKDDVINAGGTYVNEPVVRDGNIISSRLPNDLPLFCREIVAYLKEAPGGRNAGKAKLEGKPRSTAAFVEPASLVLGPAGPASANYSIKVVHDERGRAL